MRFTQKRRHARGSRSRLGTCIIEFAVTLPLLVIAACIAINLGMSLLAARTVDLAARDAARAAANASTFDIARDKAEAAASNHNVFGTPVHLVRAHFEFDEANGIAIPEQGPGPHVTVEATTNYTLPFPGTFYGAGFTSREQMFTRKYVFPIVNLRHRSVKAP